MRTLKFNGVYSRSLVLAYLLFLFCGTPAASAQDVADVSVSSVVFFWNGDEVSTLHPTANIADVVVRYQARGMRVVQAVGLPPVFFKQFVALDRKAHPEDYNGKQVSLVIHGHGARFLVPVVDVKKGGLSPVQAGWAQVAPPTDAANSPSMDRVKDEEIILAFIEGIGDKARAEAISSPCFFGQECLAVSLNDTPLANRVSRIIVPKRSAGGSLSSLIPLPTPEAVFARLSEILVHATDAK